MNVTVINKAIGSLDKALSSAKQALWDIEKETFGHPGYGESGGFADPNQALQWYLEELHAVLLVVLEAADLLQTRDSLIQAWPGFRDGKGLQHTIDNVELQICESRALTFLERLVQGLRISASEVITSEEAWTLNRLEAILRDTAVLMHRRGVSPANEMELQAVMHDYLKACFPDFRLNPPIGGTLKTFKPDCGIANIGAAVEFKIVHTKENVATAFSGVAEDTAGYKGSKDWTRFFSVIYQAQPWISEGQLQMDLKRIGAATWKPILVNGPTQSKQAAAKK